MDLSIRFYRETDHADVVDLSLRAWDPVHVSLRAVTGDQIFERLFGKD